MSSNAKVASTIIAPSLSTGVEVSKKGNIITSSRMKLATFLWAALVLVFSCASASNLEENSIDHHANFDIRTERTHIDPEVQEKVLDVVEGLCSESQSEAYEAFSQLASLKNESISAIYKMMYVEYEETVDDEEVGKILPAVTVLRECKFPRILELFRDFMNKFQKSKFKYFAIEHNLLNLSDMIPDFDADGLELLHRKILLEFQKRLHNFIFTNPRKTNWSETYLNGISAYSSMSEVLEGSLAKHISDKIFHGEEESRELLWKLWSSVNENFGVVSEEIVEAAMKMPYAECDEESEFLFHFGNWDNEPKSIASPLTEEYLSCCNSGEFASIKEEEDEEEDDCSDMPDLAPVEDVIKDFASGTESHESSEPNETNESKDGGNEGNDSYDSNVSNNESNLFNDTIESEDLSYHSLVGTYKYLLIKDVEEEMVCEEQLHDRVRVDVIDRSDDDEEDVDEIIIEAFEVEREVNEPRLHDEDVVADDEEEVFVDDNPVDQVTDVADDDAVEQVDVAVIADDQVVDIDEMMLVEPQVDEILVDPLVAGITDPHADELIDPHADEMIDPHVDEIIDPLVDELIEPHVDETITDPHIVDNTAQGNTVEPEPESDLNTTQPPIDDSVEREVDVELVIPSSPAAASIAAIISESRQNASMAKCASRKPKSVKKHGMKKVKIIKWGRKVHKKRKRVISDSTSDSTSSSSSSSDSSSDSDSELSKETVGTTRDPVDTSSDSTTASDSTNSTTSSSSNSTSNSFFSSDETFEAMENRQRTLKRPLRLVYPDGRIKIVNVTDSNKTNNYEEEDLKNKDDKDDNTDPSIKMASKTTPISNATISTNTTYKKDSTADTIFYINNVMLVALVLGMSWMIYLKWHLITAE